jgi:hypothetical protein
MYYIYFWFNVKTNEVFYVGYGSGDRRFQIKQRSQLWKRYYSENDCSVRLIHSGLSEEEARKFERHYIEVINPCCNQTRGGERTNGKKISESLKGRTFSDEHKKNLSKAAKLQWIENPIVINNKKVAVRDKDFNLIKEFDAKFQVGIWLHDELGYGKHARAAQRKADKYFKSKDLFDGKFFLVE